MSTTYVSCAVFGVRIPKNLLIRKSIERVIHKEHRPVPADAIYCPTCGKRIVTDRVVTTPIYGTNNYTGDHFIGPCTLLISYDDEAGYCGVVTPLGMDTDSLDMRRSYGPAVIGNSVRMGGPQVDNLFHTLHILLTETDTPIWEQVKDTFGMHAVIQTW